MTTCYLIHFDQPIGGEGRNSARHYVGYTVNLKRRLAQHRRGGKKAAHILAYLKQAKVGWRVVRLWRDGGEALEYRLKDAGHYDRLCPICSGEAALRRGLYGHESMAIDDPNYTSKRPKWAKGVK